MTKVYENNIFPRALVVTDSIEEVTDKYINVASEDGTFIVSSNAIATTYCVNHKNEDKGSLLLAIFKPIDVRTIAHEALHITRTILEDLPCVLDDSTEEVWCYTIGWIADCINNFRKVITEE